MKRQNHSLLKEQQKTPGEGGENNETNNLSDKELKALVIKMWTELGKRINELTENFNNELEKR